MAWWVVVGHAIHLAGAPAWMPEKLANLAVRGDSAVNVFIIVSGFVICHLLLTKDECYPQYVTRRFFRLTPVYAVCVAISIASASAYTFAYIDLPFAVEREMRLARIVETDENFLIHLAAHATMLHGAIPTNLLPFAGTTLLAPAWSLSLEWQFYLIAPLLIGLLRKNVGSYVVTAIICTTAYFISKRYVDHLFQYSSMLFLSFPFFLIGISTRLALQHMKKLGAIEAFIGAVVLLVIIARWKLEGAIWAMWCVFLCIESGLIKPASIFGQICAPIMNLVATNSAISSLGKWSYSTYLVHIPVFAIVVYVAAEIVGYGRSQLAAQLGVLAAMAMLPAISYVLHAFVEQPGISLGSRIASRYKPTSAATTVSTAV